MSLDKNKDHLIQTMFEREMTFEAWSAYMMSILVINGLKETHSICTDERGSWLKRKRK
jgi:hypothetical protein